MYCTTCDNGTNAELLECVTSWQSMASGNRGNSASNGQRRVHILRCSIEHSRQTRQGDWAGNRQAGNRESWPRVLREFLRRVNGYPPLLISPPLSNLSVTLHASVTRSRAGHSVHACIVPSDGLPWQWSVNYVSNLVLRPV